MVGLNYCYNEAINQLTLSLAAVLLSLSPIFVMILSAFLFHEKITLKKVGCTALAIAGCILVSVYRSGGGVWNLREFTRSLRGAFLRTLQRYLQRGDAKRLSYVYGLILQFTDRKPSSHSCQDLELVRDGICSIRLPPRRDLWCSIPCAIRFCHIYCTPGRLIISKWARFLSLRRVASLRRL